MDQRDVAALFENWFDRFNEESMTIEVELPCIDDESCDEVYKIPAKYEVCSLCEGAGKHVNPSIDSHGISAHDMYEDPDFAEDYFSGVYDVPCNQCKGKRVYPVVNEESLLLEENGKKIIEKINEKLISRAEWIREEHYLRRMGF